MFDLLPFDVQQLLVALIPLDERYTVFFHHEINKLNNNNTSKLSKSNGKFHVTYLDENCYTKWFDETLDIRVALNNALSIFDTTTVKTVFVSVEHSVFEYMYFFSEIKETTNNHHLVAMIDVPRLPEDAIC
jgi:hypothetical protein